MLCTLDSTGKYGILVSDAGTLSTPAPALLSAVNLKHFPGFTVWDGANLFSPEIRTVNK